MQWSGATHGLLIYDAILDSDTLIPGLDARTANRIPFQFRLPCRR